MLKRVNPNLSLVLMFPYCKRNHWILYVYEEQRNQLWVADSLNLNTKFPKELKELVQRIENQTLQKETVWRSCQQINLFDCGVHMLVNLQFWPNTRVNTLAYVEKMRAWMLAVVCRIRNTDK